MSKMGKHLLIPDIDELHKHDYEALDSFLSSSRIITEDCIWVGHMMDRKYEIICVGTSKEECKSLIKQMWEDNHEEVYGVHFPYEEFKEEYDSYPDEYYATWYSKFKIGKAYFYGVKDEQ
jgi:hypothetical protein